MGGRLSSFGGVGFFVGDRIDSPSGAEHRFVKLRLQYGTGRKRCHILCDANLAFVELEQFDLFFVFLGAEDQTNRGLLGVRPTLMLLEPPEVKFHLALI